MARIGSRYRGRHRKPSTTSHTIAKTALAGAVVSAPLVTAGQAQAAPDNVWDRVAQCESGGNWGISTGNGFQGGLQFTQSTWRSFGGSQFASTANRASREEQIVIAEKVLAGQGWNAWPVCSRKAGARGSSATQRAITVKAPVKARPAPKASTPAKGDRPAGKPIIPTVPSPRRPIEDAVPAVLPPAPAAPAAPAVPQPAAVPPAPAPLLAAATQPAAPAPARALTALPQIHQPAPATGPGVLLAASPPALERSAPAPAAAPTAPTPAAPLAAAPQPAAAPLAAAPQPAAAPTGPRHALPDPVAAPAPAHAAPAPAQAAPPAHAASPTHAAPAHAAPAHAAPAEAAPAAPAPGRTYLVRPGDTLSGIANAERVNGGWQAIYESNRGDLHSANLIRPGQQLHLG
jgi:hypothetical protein